jgi:hypothetical protein
VLRIVLPKGSLERATLELFESSATASTTLIGRDVALE